jgi:gluconolactonase
MVDTRFEVLVKLPWYTEGPAVDSRGNIFFTTLKGKVIFKIDSKGKLSEWVAANCPNGQLILPNDEHLVCESGEKSISRFDKQGKFIQYDIEGRCGDEIVSSPNDLVTDTQGGIYFTDSVREHGKVFYYKPGGTETVVARNLDFPNGIAVSRDGNTLFVAESYQNRILSFEINNGYRQKIFAALPTQASGKIIDNLPDGLRVDADGNVWVAHYGMGSIHVLSPQGNLINTIKAAFPLTSNLCLTEQTIIVTGGYGEPGPGGLLQMARGA